MLSSLIATVALGITPKQDLTNLHRVFKAGEKLSYQVKTHLFSDQTNLELGAPIPYTIDFNYDFTIDTKEVKPSGFAVVNYKRPYMTQIDGETADSPPVETKIKTDLNLELDLSPVNAVTNMKDLNDKSSLKTAAPLRTGSPTFAETQDIIGQFVGELQRMALFIGPLDSGLDFSPRLPLEDVAVGETWHHTISYQPQVIKGTDDKHAVQRLDMELKYDGVVDANGKKVHRVTGTVKLDSDASKFINQLYRGGASATGITALPLKMDINVKFDLDMETRKTLYARADSVGSWKLEVVQITRPVVEEDFKGKATIKLASVK